MEIDGLLSARWRDVIEQLIREIAMRIDQAAATVEAMILGRESILPVA